MNNARKLTVQTGFFPRVGIELSQRKAAPLYAQAGIYDCMGKISLMMCRNIPGRILFAHNAQFAATKIIM